MSAIWWWAAPGRFVHDRRGGKRRARYTVTSAVFVTLTLAGNPVNATSFRGAFAGALGPIPEALGSSIARTLPTISASSGFTYTFNLESGTFERESAILGQLFIERPQTVGHGKWNVNLSYQRVSLDTFDGKKLGELSDTSPLIIDRRAHSLLIVPRFSIALDTHQFTVSTTYGLTDDLDINITVPFIYSTLSLETVVQSITSAPGQTKPSRTAADLSTTGVGDVFLRGKYRLLEQGWGDAALGLILRVPTGNPDNFQGTGDVELAPMLYASPKTVPLGHHLALLAYVNGGVNFNAGDVDRSEARWGIGADVQVASRGTVALAVLGRHPFARSAPAGSLDFLRCLEPRRVCREDLPALDTVRTGTAPIFGIAGSRPDFYDFSIGGRLNLWRDMVIVFADALFPLNDAGPRADVIPLAGVEVVF